MSMLTEFFGRFARKPRAVDDIALKLFADISKRRDAEDPTPFIKNLTQIGARDCGTVTTIEEARALVDVLVHLPPRQRAVVEFISNGWSPAEVATVLGVTNDVVIREHTRAMGVLRAKGML
jgi:DNA-directed RNA polymerase specialized sigma24 family protein